MDDINISIMAILDENGEINGYCVRTVSMRSNPMQYDWARATKDYNSALNIARETALFFMSLLNINSVSVFDEWTDAIYYWIREADDNEDIRQWQAEQGGNL